jgi:hypothetical protein
MSIPRRHHRRRTYPFKGRTASVTKGQAKACVNKSDDRLAPKQGVCAPSFVDGGFIDQSDDRLAPKQGGFPPPFVDGGAIDTGEGKNL